MDGCVSIPLNRSLLLSTACSAGVSNAAWCRSIMLDCRGRLRANQRCSLVRWHPTCGANSRRSRPVRSACIPNCWSVTMSDARSDLLYTRVQTALRTLQLTQMAAELDALTAQAATHNWSALEYLDHLTPVSYTHL